MEMEYTKEIKNNHLIYDSYNLLYIYITYTCVNLNRLK